MKVAVIGGGAAGFFSAIQVKENHPTARVVLLEKSKRLLAKVKISGGGRCNVTNGCTSIKQLAEGYPRGGKKLKKVFRLFNNQDTQAWFQQRGVRLKTEADNRVFPISDDSQSIIDCLMKAVQKRYIQIKTGQFVTQIIPEQAHLKLVFRDNSSEVFDKVIVAAGGSPKRSGLEWLEALGHKIETPVPSLFTFNMPSENIKKLMGVVVENATVSIQGTKLKASGPLLITHWGMSGPAILKLSAFGARLLSERNYHFKAQVNWTNVQNQAEVVKNLEDISKANPNKLVSNIRAYGLPKRMWSYLLQRSEVSEQKKWGELGKKAKNKLVTTLSNDVYEVRGKTTFKEEFVTCGGVSLESVNFNSMQSRVCKNLYFAGEVLDIDGITGGYNFQAAWTTAFIAGQLLDT